MTDNDLQAYARYADPETSWEAAESLTSDTIRQSQEQVWGLFKVYGAMTDKELCVRAATHEIMQSHSGLRTRRHELVVLGILQWSGDFKLDGKRRHRIWEKADV